MGLIQLCQYNKKDENDTKQHPLYTASSHSAAFSLIGCLFLISTLPLFNLDGKFKEMESSYFIFNPMNVLYSISASAIMSFATSAIINVKINIRDFINGALSGAIAMLCAFPFIIKPVFSLIIGSTAGIIQVLAQNML
jgi:ammonia channel protein AmtB